jgi:hypothetical protein
MMAIFLSGPPVYCESLHTDVIWVEAHDASSQAKPMAIAANRNRLWLWRNLIVVSL